MEEKHDCNCSKNEEKHDCNCEENKDKPRSLASCGSNSKGRKKTATNNQWA